MNDHLGGVEIAVDAAQSRGRQAGAESLASGLKPLDPGDQIRPDIRYFRQTPMEDSKFLGHAMPARGRHFRVMHFVSGLGDLTRELRT